MPVPTETLYNIPKLNTWFAISSFLLLGGLGWLVVDDHYRNWRNHQEEFMELQASVSYLGYLETQTTSFKEKLEEMESAVRDAESDYDRRGEEIAKLEEQLRAEEVKFAEVNIAFGNQNAQIAVTKAHYEELKTLRGEEHPATIAARQHYEEDFAILAETRSKTEQAEDARRRLRGELKALRGGLTAAEKNLAKLQKVVDEAKTKYQAFAAEGTYKIMGTIPVSINAPMADFAAPKGTIGREEVRQVVLPEVRREYNFLQSYSVDRCQTCHVGIDNKQFSPEQLTQSLAEALPAINEVRAQRGQQPIPMPPDPESDEFGNVSDEKQREYFLALVEAVNAHLVADGLKPIDMKQPYWAHPRLDLYVAPGSPHPLSKMGCTVCHEGNGQETDFVLASHTPPTHEIKAEWEREYMPKVGATDFETVEHYWDFPMLLPQHIEANCAKCHTEITDVAVHENKPLASTINQGYQLYRQLGCINCHLVEGLGHYRRVGTDLRHVADKVSRPFMHEWIHFPKNFRPSTWMPHFFLQENNGPGCEEGEDPEPVLRTQTEVMAITEYLRTLSQPIALETVPPTLEADVEAGRELFGKVGCLACHAAIEHRLEPGEDAETLGQKWIVGDLRDREGLPRDQALAQFEAMSYTDRILYCMDHFPSDWDTIYHPERTIDRPVFTRYGPELSAIRQKFETDEQAVAWLYDWVRNPQHYFPGTKMPGMRLTPQESLNIASYLTTMDANREFAERLESSQFQDSSAFRAKIDELMFALLSGQNSAAMCRSIIDDEDNQLTEILINSLRKSLGERAARDLVGPMEHDRKKEMFVGFKSITHYGCYACHNIVGFETATRPGTELTEWGFKELSKLDFGFYDTAFHHERGPEFDHLYPEEREDLVHWAAGENPHEQIEHNRGAFAFHKMRNPRIFDRKKIKGPYEKLKMPNFFLRDDQADALVTYLLSRRPPLVNDSLKIDYGRQPLGSIAEGRNQARDLNCMGCHRIENNATVVQQYYTKTEAGKTRPDENLAPPWLRGEGAKIQYPWLNSFFHNVETIRPWLNVRMPSFAMSNEESTTLVEYFAGLVTAESEMLEDWIGGIEKYVSAQSKNAGGTHPAAEEAADNEASPPPGSDWYLDPTLADVTEKLIDYAVKNRLANPYSVNLRDPDMSAEDWTPTFSRIRGNVEFLHELYRVNYPYTDSPQPQQSEAAFVLGGELFSELKCLACHVLGDSSVEGSNPAPSAPNLNLTARRLRHEWFHQWLQEPGVIQPGANMPQWFGSASSAFKDYPPEDRTAMEAKFGMSGEEQMTLLMNFVYDAGIRNHTATLPPGSFAVPADDDEEGEDEGEWNDDEFEDDSESADEDDGEFQE